MCTRPREGQRLGDRGRGGEPTETNAGVVRQTGTSKGVCDHNPRTGNAPGARRKPPEVKHLVIKHGPQEVWGQVAQVHDGCRRQEARGSYDRARQPSPPSVPRLRSRQGPSVRAGTVFKTD